MSDLEREMEALFGAVKSIPVDRAAIARAKRRLEGTRARRFVLRRALPAALAALAFAGTAVAAVGGVEWAMAPTPMEGPAKAAPALPQRRGTFVVRSRRMVPRASELHPEEPLHGPAELHDLKDLEVKPLEVGGYLLPELEHADAELAAERKVSSATVTHAHETHDHAKPDPPALLFDRHRLRFRVRRGTEP